MRTLHIPFFVTENDCPCGYTFAVLFIGKITGEDMPGNFEYAHQIANYCPYCGSKIPVKRKQK